MTELERQMLLRIYESAVPLMVELGPQLASLSTRVGILGLLAAARATGEEDRIALVKAAERLELQLNQLVSVAASYHEVVSVLVGGKVEPLVPEAEDAREQVE